jgi:hypothetical protein
VYKCRLLQPSNLSGIQNRFVEKSANYLTDDKGLPMTMGLSAMTEEKLQARKQEAEKAREQALANARHWGGVIADCDYWLEESRKDERAEQKRP